MSSTTPSFPVRSGARVADIVATIVLLLALGLLAAYVSLMGMFIAMASDGCYGDCTEALIMTGMLVAMILPWVAFLAALVWAIVRLARHKIAWWVPVLMAVGAFAALPIGSMIAIAGVP